MPKKFLKSLIFSSLVFWWLLSLDWLVTYLAIDTDGQYNTFMGVNLIKTSSVNTVSIETHFTDRIVVAFVLFVLINGILVYLYQLFKSEQTN